MEHQEAIEMYAAEAYLLDDLTEAERDAFEKHFADCDHCFADVRDGVRFIHALPEAVKEGRAARERRWPSLAAAAMIACAATAAFFQMVLLGPLKGQIAALRQPHVARPLDIVLDTRGQEQPPVFTAWQSFTLRFDTPYKAPPPFHCVVIDEHGTPQSTVDVFTATSNVEYEVPGLATGNYIFKVWDAHNSVTKFPFRVQ